MNPFIQGTGLSICDNNYYRFDYITNNLDFQVNTYTSNCYTSNCGGWFADFSNLYAGNIYTSNIYIAGPGGEIIHIGGGNGIPGPSGVPGNNGNGGGGGGGGGFIGGGGGGGGGGLFGGGGGAGGGGGGGSGGNGNNGNNGNNGTNGTIDFNPIWYQNSSNAYILNSNVCIGKSNGYFPLDVSGSIRASQNIYASAGVFNNIVTTNEIATNLQGRNLTFDNSRLNNIQVSSIILDNSINKQVLNSIQKASTSSPSTITIYWSIIASSMIIVDITTQVSTSSSSATRTDRYDINTATPVSLTPHNPFGNGDIDLLTNIFSSYITTSQSVAFTMQSPTSGITFFDTSLKVISYNNQIGKILIT